MNIFQISAIFLGICVGILLPILIDSMMRSKKGDLFRGSEHELQNLVSEQASLRSRLKEIDEEIAKVANSSNSKPSLPSSEHVAKKASTETKEEVKPKICPYDFKVYVYQIPKSLDSVKVSEEARRNYTLHICQKCIFEQFALEYIVHDFFNQFCGRTYDPEEADFFYLPIIRDAEFRLHLESGARNRAPSVTELTLLQVLEKSDTTQWKSVFNITDKYWKTKNGMDHIIVMPAPVTNLRHESSQRGYFHYMMHLHTPIFLNVEYSLQFVKEYPVCATQKNIVMPYPTTDPDLFTGKLASYNITRDALLYYAGGLHGDCIETRKAMKQIMANSTRIPGVLPKIKSNLADRELGFLAAKFCPIPVGDSPSSKRMYDVLNFGCIPVVLSDDLLWAYSLQTGGTINTTLFALQFPQSLIQYTAQRTLKHYANRRTELGILPFSGTLVYDLLAGSVQRGGEFTKAGQYVNPLVQVLQSIPAEDIHYLQANIAAVSPMYRYYALNKTLHTIPTAFYHFPGGGAMDMLTNLLRQRKAAGITKIGAACQAERVQKHKYVSRYSCDTDKKESLLRRRR